MAEALAFGLKKEGRVVVVGRNKERLDYFKKSGIESIAFDSFSAAGKKIILAIKPYALKEVSSYFKNQKTQLLISILAGIKIKTIKTFISSISYARAMPNTAAIVHSSITAICGDAKAKGNALKIFSSIGKTIWLEKEEELDIATAIGASAPAFLAMVAEAISDAGVMCGLTRNTSKELTNGLFKSFSKLIEKKDTLTLKEEITSPAGTTAEGIKALEKRKIRYAFIEAIEKTYLKAKSNK
jgi:pyrroline-5-carboxylate reductase